MNDLYYRHINGVPYKMHCFIEMQFAAYFYTVVPYQAFIHKLSHIKVGCIFLSFCKIRDFGSPTMSINFNCKMSEKQLSLNCEKSVKINLRIISKLHSHLQSSVKTSLKFRKNRNKTIGRVAHTRYPLSIHFHCKNA